MLSYAITLHVGAGVELFLQTVAALNDETRVLIVRFLDTHGALCVCDLQHSLGMIQSRLSRHLKILKDAGFLRVDRRGTWAYYSIRQPIDRFRLQAIEEIRTLPLELPPLKKECAL
jgi:ArsR family transcriptional regulator, arsenate/arsenite/antimonite-responsive transcriptional repressor